ncbi:hypothetical protein CICLE_v10023171mg [Citrus x clementina]|uniref:Uncharacterized protein n=1 Tax=Citrus clementina TaxID=85681 RepID=V4T4B9_CITCL|nr:hypothetical protein CICLE_v10023171mg [Citrus x clementina]
MLHENGSFWSFIRGVFNLAKSFQTKGKKVSKRCVFNFSKTVSFIGAQVGAHFGVNSFFLLYKDPDLQHKFLLQQQ